MPEPVKKPNAAPENYGPRIPEIVSMSHEISDRTKLPYTTVMKDNEPDSFETGRLIIRHFRPEDWQDLQQIAVSKENSEFADCDHTWPVDEKSMKGVSKYFAGSKQCWAVEVKSIQKVVCFVNFNGMNDSGEMDIGHVMNGEFSGNDYEFEALGVLYDYCFKQTRAVAVIAGWAMEDKEKLEPLLKLGMTAVSLGRGPAMREGKDGLRREVESCRLVISREQWEK